MPAKTSFAPIPVQDLSSMTKWKRWILHPAFVPTCIGVGLLIRFFTASFIPVEPFSDTLWYVNRAREIAEGLGYQEGGHPTAYWPVGWPAILAGGLLVLGSASLAIITLNMLASLLIMWLIVWFGEQITGNTLTARLALLGYVLYPNHIAYSGTASTELAYTAIAMAAFALLIKGRDRTALVLLSGLVFGIGTLIKPQTLAFPFGAVIALALVYRDYSWISALRAGIVVYITIFAVVLPWSYRNQAVLGEFVLVSTNGGVALLLGANDQMTGDHFDNQYTPVFEQFEIPWDQRIARQVELNDKQKEAALAWIGDNTASWIAWMPRKVLKLWLKDTDGFWAFSNSYPDALFTVRLVQIANQIYYLLILSLSAICCLVAARAILQQNAELMKLGLLFCMPVFVSLLAAVFTGQIRYHFPAMPFLFVAAAWTIVEIERWAESKKSR